jgi:thiamine-monophosphate kinase
VGGNLAATDSAIVVDVTLLGVGSRLLLRSTAHPGDLVVVTGTLGAAAAGLRCLSEGARLSAEGALEGTGRLSERLSEHVRRCLRAQLDPAPPLGFARALADHDLAHAAMDLSDGLSGDLLTLCEASGVSAWLDPDRLPVDPHAASLEEDAGRDGLALALHGGEDYELLLAVPPDRFEALRDLARSFSVAVTVVGELAAGPASVALRAGGGLRPLEPRSYDHFTDPRRERRADPSTEA